MSSGPSSGRLRTAWASFSTPGPGDVEGADESGVELGEALPAPRGELVGDRIAGLGDPGQQLVVGEDGTGGSHQRPESAGPDLGSGRRGEDVLGLVGLVEHEHVVIAEDRAIGGQVQAVEVEVDDRDVGAERIVAGLLGEAGRTARAAVAARAFARSDADRLPGGRRRGEVELGLVAGRGLLRPRPHPRQLLGGGPVGCDVEGELLARPIELGEALDADIVGAALQDAEPQRAIDVSGQEGEVLGRELVLEGLGRGRHDDATAAGDGGHQVGERLAGAGPGLDGEVPPGLDRCGDGPEHGPLARAVLGATGQAGQHGVEERFGSAGQVAGCIGHVAGTLRPGGDKVAQRRSDDQNRRDDDNDHQGGEEHRPSAPPTARGDTVEPPQLPHPVLIITPDGRMLGVAARAMVSIG